MSCPPGTIRNPYTYRCLRATGRRARQLIKEGAIPPQLPPRQIQPLRQTQRRVQVRRQLSEPPLRLPLGTATVAPLADRTTILDWTRANCTNDTDPISGVPFVSAESAALQEIIRLHNRTCTLATPLHTKIVAEHKTGQIATMPDDPTTALTLDDFTALRDAMRRRIPDYKLPARKHMPPPPNWKLYIASDNRSGPEFASVLYVDVTKAKTTAYGVVYPLDSVMVDLGFLPIEMASTSLTPMMFVELFKHLDGAGRLLLAVPGGWKPAVAPPSKKYWETDRARKLQRYYTDLQKSLSAAV
jgi:hypothetical protein